ncbi:xyloside xylosyltransferase 1-like [Haemaphysalis longicornis]
MKKRLFRGDPKSGAPLRVAFVIGCGETGSSAYGNVVDQLGEALDSLLLHSSRSLHVDVAVPPGYIHDLHILMEHLTPRMMPNVAAVVDLFPLEMLLDISSDNKSTTVATKIPQSDPLLPLCTALHKVFRVPRLLAMAPTVLFHADVAVLWAEFDLFSDGAVFALAREQSARYAELLSKPGNVNSNGCGNPPTTSGGNYGYNAAVALLDLDAARRSQKYSRLSVQNMAATYGWTGKAVLQDQDFYTMAACSEPSLLHQLPCSWNRQVPAKDNSPPKGVKGVRDLNLANMTRLHAWCEGGTYICSARCPQDD